MSAHKVIAGLTIVSAFALCFLLTPTFAEEELARDSRTGKLLNIFQVVRFPNDACNTTAGDQGVCYTATECTSRSGTNSGTCASGFGVCCSFSVKCGATTNQNNTYFSSTDTDTSPCTVKICPCSDDICQIRLDFDRFDIAQPESTEPFITTIANVPGLPNSRTNCLEATFTATSDGSNVPIICGTNTGQHMILEADGNQCNTLSFGWNTATPRTWKIKTSQISCKDPHKPPEGCLQYYTAASGTVQSFNFAGGVHLANQDYEACIRTAQGNCQINWSTVPTTAYGLGSATATNKIYGDLCSIDYVVIPSGFKKGGAIAMNSDRFCGAIFGSEETAGAATETIASRRIPFTLRFHTDSGESDNAASAGIGDDADDMVQLGFSLAYTQTAC